jgi:hypothetical protein
MGALCSVSGMVSYNTYIWYGNTYEKRRLLRIPINIGRQNAIVFVLISSSYYIVLFLIPSTLSIFKYHNLILTICYIVASITEQYQETVNIYGDPSMQIPTYILIFFSVCTMFSWINWNSLLLILMNWYWTFLVILIICVEFCLAMYLACLCSAPTEPKMHCACRCITLTVLISLAQLQHFLIL